MKNRLREAIREFPVCCAGSLDQEETIADYVATVKHEINLYEEGEETDILTARDLKACKAYIAKYREQGQE